MKDFIHFVLVPLTGVGYDSALRRDSTWYARRVEIFKRYTWRSLRNQTSKDFILWIILRPEERDHPATRVLEEYLGEERLRYVLTFDGLPYFDDKFDTRYMPTIKNYLRNIRQSIRARNCKGFFESLRLSPNKNKTLEERLARSLESLTREKYPWVLLTRIDSDDLFHRDALATIQRREKFQGAYTMRNGFVYNTDMDELASWEPETNPPFHTIMFPADTFFDAKSHLAYYKDFASHEDIPRVFASVGLPDGLYCVTVRNPREHLSTVWNHPFRGAAIIDEAKKKEIMENFGLN